MAGLWYEDFEIGKLYRHPITRTVTETDNILFSTLTHNAQPCTLTGTLPPEPNGASR